MFFTVVSKDRVFNVFLLNHVPIGNNKSVGRHKKSGTRTNFFLFCAVLALARNLEKEIRKHIVAKKIFEISERTLLFVVSFIFRHVFGQHDGHNRRIGFFDRVNNKTFFGENICFFYNFFGFGTILILLFFLLRYILKILARQPPVNRRPLLP